MQFLSDSSLLAHALNDIASPIGKLRILEMFEIYLRRSAVFSHVVEQLSGLVKSLETDLYEVQQIISVEAESPPEIVNMPAVSSALRWSRGLRLRVDQAMERLKQVFLVVFISFVSSLFQLVCCLLWSS